MGEEKVTVADLWAYPGKGTAANLLPVMELGPTGPLRDRLFCFVDASTGNALTQRRLPRLVLVQGAFRTDDPWDGVCLSATGMDDLAVVPRFEADPRSVTMPGGAACAGIDQGDAAAAWATKFLNEHRPSRVGPVDVRMLWLPRDNQRVVQDPPFPEVPISFVDGHQVLVTGRGSHREIARRIGAPINELRWRPGLVLDGLSPFEEEQILVARVYRGGRFAQVMVVFDKLNTRCKVINVNPADGTVGPDLLRWLTANRSFPEPTTGAGGPKFGVNVHFVAQPGAYIEMGDEIRVTQWRDAA